MSKSAKLRAHREARKIQPVTPRQAQTTARTVTPAPDAKRHKTGLEWMVAKKKLTQHQLMAGMRYGLHFRLAEVEGMDSLRSCLNDEPRGGVTTATATRPQVDTEARDKLLSARQALAFHVDMIAACDMICGRGFTPWEIIDRAKGGQREVEKLQTSLGIALDLLHAHYRLTK